MDSRCNYSFFEKKDILKCYERHETSTMTTVNYTVKRSSFKNMSANFSSCVISSFSK